MDFGYCSVAYGSIRRSGLPDGSKPAPFDSPAVARIKRALGSIGRFQQSFGTRLCDGGRAGFTDDAVSNVAVVPGWGKFPVLVRQDLLETGKRLPKNGGRELASPFPRSTPMQFLEFYVVIDLR